MRFSLRSRMSIVFSLVALISIIGGFMVFVGTGASNTAQAKGLALNALKPIQKRLLDGLVSSELDPPQLAASTKAAVSQLLPHQ